MDFPCFNLPRSAVFVILFSNTQDHKIQNMNNNIYGILFCFKPKRYFLINLFILYAKGALKKMQKVH